MKLTQLIAVAALLNVNVDEVAAIRRHHHHHNYELVNKVTDIHLNDPAFKELQAKKVALKDAIEEETMDKPLTEEEEKEKFDKEVKGLETEGKIVNAKTKLADYKKKLAKIETEGKDFDGEVLEPKKKTEFEKKIP